MHDQSSFQYLRRVEAKILFSTQNQRNGQHSQNQQDQKSKWHDREFAFFAEKQEKPLCKSRMSEDCSFQQERGESWEVLFYSQSRWDGKQVKP
mmetsp:Transcript_32336/g.40577  ORF Transcript_32336/g.40577 Transcript_32336/m.40577 type:complete len:93 (-) Transcript_32336:169-447(-)